MKWMCAATFVITLTGFTQVDSALPPAGQSDVDKATAQYDAAGIASQITPGMLAKEVETRLRPVLIARGYTFQSGSGWYAMAYSLQGGLQLVLGVDRNGRVDRVKGPEPKARWSYLQWDPEESDVATATHIATARIEEAARTGNSTDEILPPSAMGRPLSETRTVSVGMGPEGTKRLKVTSYGKYRTHRLVILDFLDSGIWRFHVEVDLDDNMVVPFKWTPTDVEIQRAREIADPIARRFFAGSCEFRGAGQGDYDLGPTRRILSLTYCRPEESSELCYDVDVDMENLCQVDYSLWGPER